MVHLQIGTTPFLPHDLPCVEVSDDHAALNIGSSVVIIVRVADEFELINWIRARQRQAPAVQLGIGDDLAILRWRADDLLLAGVDQVLDGVHFDSAIHTPRQIGRKVMNRNLSDCAAMGCLPVAALATVALPRGSGADYGKELYLGLRDAADLFDCDVVGGDTASWPGKLVVTVSIVGRSGGVVPITRGGAKAGDDIYVTGPLGGSLLGRHMNFEPRVVMGRQLATDGIATAMIDLSDGLSRDLIHICDESGVGAVIDAGAVPIHADAIEMSRRDPAGPTPLERALHDGEDYELLFTAGGALDLQATRIGKIVSEKGIWIETNGQRELLKAQGWEHRL